MRKDKMKNFLETSNIRGLLNNTDDKKPKRKLFELKMKQ